MHQKKRKETHCRKTREKKQHAWVTAQSHISRQEEKLSHSVEQFARNSVWKEGLVWGLLTLPGGVVSVPHGRGRHASRKEESERALEECPNGRRRTFLSFSSFHIHDSLRKFILLVCYSWQVKWKRISRVPVPFSSSHLPPGLKLCISLWKAFCPISRVS